MTTSTTSTSLQEPRESSFDYPPASESTISPNLTGVTATVDRIAGSAHETIDRIASVANSAAEQMSMKSEDLMAAKERWMESCSTYVRENPLTALGIAVAAGFLLSRIMR
jgi:ElaB/YqjD/DUF883 family membrane-anchored ribosome-binding protein